MQGFDINAFAAFAQQINGQNQQQQAPQTGYQVVQAPGFGQVQQLPQQLVPVFPPVGMTPVSTPQPVALPMTQQLQVPVWQPQPPVQTPTPNVIFFGQEWHPQYGWMSNFFPSPFTGTKGHCKYFSVEHYYMEKKALCADDEESRLAIMAVQVNVVGPDGQVNWQLNNQVNLYVKQLGQKIRTPSPDNAQKWEMLKTQVMRTALFYKFSQNQALYDLLLKTGDDVLFEASDDEFWGIGCTEQQARSGEVPIDDFGRNLTGFLLMEIRSTFRKTGKPEWAVVKAEKPAISMTRAEVATEAPVNPLVSTVPVEEKKEDPKIEIPKDKVEVESQLAVVQAEAVQVAIRTEFPENALPMRDDMIRQHATRETVAAAAEAIGESVPLSAIIEKKEPLSSVLGMITTVQPVVPDETAAEPVMATGSVNKLLTMLG